MDAFILYTLKSSYCLSAGYLMYILLIRRKTFHRIKRFVLLAIILSSLIIPELTIPVNPERTDVVFEQQKPAFLSAVLSVIPEKTDSSTQEQTPENKTVSLIQLIYLTGFTIQIILLLNAMRRIFILFRKSDKIKYNGLRLALIPQNNSPFCFGRYIMISEKDFQEHGDKIIRHEQTHLNAWHGFDLLIIEIYLALTWYNPFAWLIRFEIKQNHEFEADRNVLRSGYEPTDYQLLLVKTAVGERRFRLANQFYQINIKTRINMMNKRKSSSLAMLRIMFFIPLIALMVQVFAQKEITASGSEGKVNTNGKYLQLNGDELKSVGFTWTHSGLFYKNIHTDGKDKRTLCLYFTDSTYSASIILNEGEKITGLSLPEKFLKKQKPTNFDFYPVAVTSFDGFRTLDMTASLNNPGEELLPVQINLADLNAGNRKDTLVFWFRFTESLKTVLPLNLNAASFLQPCPQNPPNK